MDSFPCVSHKVEKSGLLELEIDFELKGVPNPSNRIMRWSMTILDDHETIITFSLFRPFSSYDAWDGGT